MSSSALPKHILPQCKPARIPRSLMLKSDSKEDSIYLLLGNYLVLAVEKMIELLINPEKCLKVDEKTEKPAKQEEENERT